MPEQPAPSPFFSRHRDVLEERAELGPALDLACGRGRHTHPLLAMGFRVVALDRNVDFLRTLRGCGAECVLADAEDPAGLPLRAESFAVIVVARFLYRPLAPLLSSLLTPGGLLLWETFTERQRSLGYGPSQTAHLLAEGELSGLCPDLQTIEYDEGLRREPREEWVASLLARRD